METIIKNTMKVISIINLKGGVGKSITAINFACILALVFNKRVLLIDCDKQGNSSKFFDLHSYEDKSMSDIMTEKYIDIKTVIKPTKIKGLDLIPANMSLLSADRKVLLDPNRAQQTRLKKALKQVEGEYDFVIIDNAPDINMSIINSLVVTDDVIVPIKIDKFAFDGFAELVEQIEEIRDEHNEKLNIRGCVVTMYQKNNVNSTGIEFMNKNEQYPMFKAFIRNNVKVNETTFTGEPLYIHSKNCTASKDYIALVEEYLGVEKSAT